MRIRRSHHIMARQGVHTPVPVHGGRTLKIGTLRGILRDINLSALDFTRLVEGLTRIPLLNTLLRSRRTEGRQRRLVLANLGETLMLIGRQR